MRGYLIAVMTGVVLAGSTAEAQTQQPRHMMHALMLAGRALHEGDTAQAVRMLEAARTFGPYDTRVLYDLARVHALRGNGTAAIEMLERLATAGGSVGISAEPPFAGLKNDTSFAAALAAVAIAAAPIVRSDTLRIVPLQDLVPEGIAYDSTDRTFYLGSIAQQQIIRFKAAGPPAVLVRTGGEVLGVRVDRARHRLLAAIRIPDVRAPQGITGGRGWAALIAYDLRNGSQLLKVQLTDTTRAHVLNDIAVTAGGAVYVSDSEAGTVLRLTDDATLQPIIPTDRLVYPNGVTLSADERALFVAHVDGILRVDLSSGVATSMPMPPGQSMGFIDGLYRHGNTLIGVQGLRDLHRIVRLTLSADEQRIVGIETLEQRHPEHRTPTTGAVVENHFVYIANSELDRLRPDGSLDETSKGGPVIILRLPL